MDEHFIGETARKKFRVEGSDSLKILEFERPLRATRFL